MSRAAAVALMAMAVIGCGDSETARLPAKSLAVLVDPQGSPVNLYVIGQAEPQKERTPHGVAIPSGTAVQVLEDDDFRSSSDRRMVEVQVTAGERRELVGFVVRSKLRPEPAK
jgi:hypothetical protein